jgi:hypothetical protein
MKIDVSITGENTKRAIKSAKMKTIKDLAKTIAKEAIETSPTTHDIQVRLTRSGAKWVSEGRGYEKRKPPTGWGGSDIGTFTHSAPVPMNHLLETSYHVQVVSDNIVDIAVISDYAAALEERYGYKVISHIVKKYIDNIHLVADKLIRYYNQESEQGEI